LHAGDRRRTRKSRALCRKALLVAEPSTSTPRPPRRLDSCSRLGSRRLFSSQSLFETKKSFLSDFSFFLFLNWIRCIRHSPLADRGVRSTVVQKMQCDRRNPVVHVSCHCGIPSGRAGTIMKRTLRRWRKAPLGAQSAHETGEPGQTRGEPNCRTPARKFTVEATGDRCRAGDVLPVRPLARSDQDKRLRRQFRVRLPLLRRPLWHGL
jgi:hypothetical protein